MSRRNLPSALSRAFYRLFHGACNRRVRRELCRKASSTRPAGSARRRLRPCLETLEDRITPATFTPTTLLDDGSANSLRGILTQANADTDTDTDTIQLAAGLYKLKIDNSSGKHEQGNAQGDLNITSSKHALVIQGTTDAKGHPTSIIDQTVKDRVFQVLTTGFTVTFKDLVIEGGQAQDDGSDGAAAGSTDAEGGGILDDGGNVILTNVVLQDNAADAGPSFDAKGGGIYGEKGGSLTIQSSVLQANGAFGGDEGTAPNSPFFGGAAEGGGIFASCSTILTRSSVSGNVLTGGKSDKGNGGFVGGGGIFTVGPTSISDSILSDNTLTAGKSGDADSADAEGGSVLAGGSATVTIANSILSGNTLKGGIADGNPGGDARGGGIYVSGSGPTTLTASTLSGNTLIGGNGTGHLSDPIDGGGRALGGGVYTSSSGTLTLTASTLSGNTLTGGNGTISDSKATINGNVGGDVEGGGVYAIAPATTDINSCILSDNTLTGGDGSFASGTVKGSIGGDAEGGGVYASGPATLTASTLSGNTLVGGNASASGTLVSVANGEAYGGGGYFLSSGAKLINSTIADNQGTGGHSTLAGTASNAVGGGLYFDKTATATLTNVTVADNTVSLPQGGKGDTVGGGIFNNSGKVTLVNTLVARNNAAASPDYFGAVSTGSGHNLIGNADGSSGFSADHGDLLGNTASPLDPQLGPLANNGGPTQTLALLPGSLALNAGINSALSVTGPFDQRGQGFLRVAGGTIDIGAFEVQSSPSSSKPPTSKTPPTLHTPPLLAFFDSLLAGVETVNGNETETVIDRIFGIPLLVSLYDGAGNLISVTLFGINVTALFELL